MAQLRVNASLIHSNIQASPANDEKRCSKKEPNDSKSRGKTLPQLLGIAKRHVSPDLEKDDEPKPVQRVATRKRVAPAQAKNDSDYYSDDDYTSSNKPKRKRCSSSTLTFPQSVHLMVTETAISSPKVIEWVHEGEAFIVHHKVGGLVRRCSSVPVSDILFFH